MVKYYKELEHPNQSILPLVYEPEPYFHLTPTLPPNSFFIKYSNLFHTLKNLDQFISVFNYNSIPIQRHIMDKNLYEIYDDLYSDFENLMLEDYCFIKELWKKTNITTHDIHFLLQFYQRIFTYLEPFYDKKSFNYDNLKEKINAALLELNNYTYMKQPTTICQQDVVLPNAWFITSYGELWNTTGNRLKGHSVATLASQYSHVRKAIFSNQKIDESNKELEKYHTIMKNGYITYYDYKTYLNQNGYPATLDDIPSYKEIIEYKVFNPKIIQLVLGVCSAQLSFYKFFEDLQKYTNNPKYEYDKLIDMVANDILDISVRCTGSHKMWVSNTKTIATSSVYCISELSEYLKRGWNIDYTPPIIINKEKGTLEQLDSLIVERHMEKELEKYEKEKEKGYGKIFY